MSILRYATHPQVRVSAEIPVPRWGLSELGRTRAERFAEQPWLASTARLISSGETKALETAALVAARTGLAIDVRESLHENDRSTTGFVEPRRFETLADQFFARPVESVEGWESAFDAQARVVASTADLVADDDRGDALIVGHGAVGTLLMCALAGLPISRSLDQVGGSAAPGGGNLWAFDRSRRTLIHRWRPFDR